MHVHSAFSAARRLSHRGSPHRQHIASGVAPRGRSWQPARYTSTLAAPPPPPPPGPPPPSPAKHHSNSSRSAERSTDNAFAQSFLRAATSADDAAHSPSQRRAQLNDPAAASSLSPWLQYLLGFRDTPPHAQPSALLTSSPAAPAEVNTVFVHHVFANASDAALYGSVRSPKDFLPPVRRHKDTGNDAPLPLEQEDEEAVAPPEWGPDSVFSAFQRIEAALHGMAQSEAARRGRGGGSATAASGAALPESLVVPFRRAMLEQAFLEQFCDSAALALAAVSAGAPTSVHSLYAYPYAEQPAALRRQLEHGLRALLCASATTVHAQWERFMLRRGSSSALRELLGLELVLLWWYANPDQMPVELAASTLRFPVPTVRLQRSMAGRRVAAASTWGSPDGSGHGAVVTVEAHLRQYVEEGRRAGGGGGGLLCPAAVFPPSYVRALRRHLRQVRHRKDAITCPLFSRLLEVAVMVGSAWPPSAPESWEEEEGAAGESANTLTRTEAGPAGSGSGGEELPMTAARRARQIARYMVVDWLWPVVCDRPLSSASPSCDLPQWPHSSPTVQELLHPAAAAQAGASARFSPSTAGHNTSTAADLFPERVEDWAVLVATVAAVALMRRHLPSLRRSRVGRRGAETAASATADPTRQRRQGMSLSSMQDGLYPSVMRCLLSPYSGTGSASAAVAAPPATVPSWTRLVFTTVALCFDECGWLRPQERQQPAMPARLWCELHSAICATFPHVFHAGNSVTVLWTLAAVEGAASLPAAYRSTYRPLNKGTLEALQAWTEQLGRDASPVNHGSTSPRHGDECLPCDARGTALDTALAVVEEQGGAGHASLCPQPERRERAAHVATAASEASAAEVQALLSRGTGTASADGGRVSSLRHPMRRSRAVLAPSFATPPPPPPPAHADSLVGAAEMQCYLEASREINAEAADALTHIFRRYATLPVLQATEAGGGDASSMAAGVGGVSAQEERAVRLRRVGQPSFFVLLKLLHSLAHLGDAFAPPTAGGAGEGGGAGLVPSVLGDVMPVCRPAVSAHLGRTLLHVAVLSGRSGALAVLRDESLQEHLNKLPAEVGRRRLTTALLWSGLTVHALTEASEAEESGKRTPTGSREGSAQKRQAAAGTRGAVFGSGSLAWHVMGSNQLHFFALAPHPADGAAAAALKEGPSDTAGARNSVAGVCGLVAEAVRHLGALALAAADPARCVVSLRESIGAFPSAAIAEPAATAGGAAEGSEKGEGWQADSLSDSPDVAHESHADASAAFSDSCFSGVPPDDGEAGQAEWHSSDAEEGEGDGSAGWADEMASPSEGDDADADTTALNVMALAIEDEPLESRWSAAETLRPAAAVAAEPAVNSGKPAGDDTMPEAAQPWPHPHAAPGAEEQRRALVAALHRTPIPAQHLFYSLLELLAWVANAQQSSTALPLDTDDGNGGEEGLAGTVGQPAWCAQLARNYSICTRVWAARVGVCPPPHECGQHSGDMDFRTCVLDSVTVAEETLFVVLQTCPDVYVVALLLLTLALRGSAGSWTVPSVQRAMVQRWRQERSFPFTWQVQCAVAQLLFHAGVTAASVQRWKNSSSFPSTSGVALAASAAAGGEEAMLAQLLALHTTLQRFVGEAIDTNSSSSSTCSSESAALNSAPGVTAHDVLMGIGAVLLASLQLLAQQSAARHRMIYPYNFYINEFMQHSNTAKRENDGPSPEVSVRAVLPSLQLLSPWPWRAPPQKVVPLWMLWRDGIRNPKKATLRRAFRALPPRLPAPMPHRGAPIARDDKKPQPRQRGSETPATGDDDDEYVRSFL